MLSALPEAVARPVLVQKYGGTSLATPARIKRVAQRIARILAAEDGPERTANLLEDLACHSRSTVVI